MTNEEIKADIIAACEKAKAEGYEIIVRAYGFVDDNFKCACALTSVAIANNAPDLFCNDEDSYPEFRISTVRGFAQQRYGWSPVQSAHFMNGFDGGPTGEGTPEHELGQAVHAAVLP